jgi:uncharacterized OB-fold protein
VYSFTWIHTAAHPSLAEALPYNVVVVEFPELPGVRLVSNVVDVERGKLAVGDRLSLIWESARDGVFLPRFRKAS